MHEMIEDDTDPQPVTPAERLDGNPIRIDPQSQDVPASIPEMHANPSSEAQRRELELQLQKIRSEASAARLDAKAAEIELMIRRLSVESSRTVSASSPGPPVAPSSTDLSSSTGISSMNSKRCDDGGKAASPLRVDDPTASERVLFHDWNQVRNAMNLPTEAPDIPVDRAAHDPTIWTRGDPAHPVARHHFDATPETESATEVESATEIEPDGSRLDRGSVYPSDDTATDAVDEAFKISSDADSAAPQPSDPTAAAASVGSFMVGPMPIDAELEVEDDQHRTRSRPGAWLVSALAHVAILVLLAAVGLTQHRPKDQVALIASAPSAEQVSMETFEIESIQPQTDPHPSEPNHSEVQVDLSPVGDISASEMISQSPPAPTGVSMSALLSRSDSAARAMSLKPNAEATLEFCGVKGGGNHFVYLVDSSGSMGDAFGSARAELLRSIDLLKPEQRFYVIFFDAEPDYMRLADANVNESRSAKATRTNRDALKRWAMRINMDRGSAPYESLRFALKLKPDVIFLLSDGEFPQGIEDLLKDENRIVNLFGDDDPISIIHTIGYHSKEGESRMKRIAQQHQGMYRHVPKP